jgi:ribosomal protein S18 acetylase RimI-like enzyme
MVSANLAAGRPNTALHQKSAAWQDGAALAGGQMDQASIVKYRHPIPDDYAAIAALIRAVWPDRAVDAARIAAWVAGSSCALVAEASESVVGFVRIISDDVSSAYIPMLVVRESFRRQGIGRQLIAAATHGFSNPEITWVLRARAGTEPFWSSMGFRSSSRAMERVRTRG